MDISEYTNYPDLHNELELAKYNCALWHRHLPGIDPLFTNDILKKLHLVDYGLEEYSLDTVKMFYNDAVSAGFKI